MIGAAFGLGFIIGPMIGGLLGDLGPRVPFMAAAGLTFMNLLYGYFVLPESLSLENRRPFDWKRANPVGTLMSLWKYPLIAITLVYIAAHAVQSNWAYYTIEKFNWTPASIGISLAVVGFVFALVQGVLIRKIIPALGQHKSVYIGLAFNAAGLLLYALASQGWMMFAITVVYCLGGIAGPALQGIMSGIVPANAQGELQGGFTSLMSVTSIIGPPIMNNLFAFFTIPGSSHYFPGAAMLLGSLLTVTSALLARNTLKKKLPSRQSQPVVT
jgi:DHA1 family tetracycline resistance protein-like MFS transporter